MNPAALGKQSGGGGGQRAAGLYFQHRGSGYSPGSIQICRGKPPPGTVQAVAGDHRRRGPGPAGSGTGDGFFQPSKGDAALHLAPDGSKGKAQDILVKGKMPPGKKLLSAGIKTILERRPVHSATRYPIALGDFLTRMSMPGQEPIASSAEIYPMREATTGGRSGETGRPQPRALPQKRIMCLLLRGPGFPG